MTWQAPAVSRVDEPFVGDERLLLEGYLDWYRSTLRWKCAGLAGAELAQAACPPSNLTLLGLIRHLTDVERTWFRRRFGGQSVPPVYYRDDRPDAAFDDVDPNLAQQAFEMLAAECDLARQAVAGVSLEATYVSERWGPMSLRWGYNHMIEEYARHCGHADLLRQAIDGETG